MREYCYDAGIVFQAYASLGAGAIQLMEDQAIVDIAKRHQVSPAQVDESILSQMYL